MPGNVFLVGRTFGWCAKESATGDLFIPVATSEGGVEARAAPGEEDCPTFRATAVGRAQVKLSTRATPVHASSFDVDVVEPTAVRAIDFFADAALLEKYSMEEALSVMTPITSYPAESDVHDCAAAPKVRARFQTVDGRWGVVPDDAIAIGAAEVTATLGAVTAKVPNALAIRCPALATAKD